MDRGTVLLLGLQKNLREWLHTIRRAVHATNTYFTPLDSNGEFSLVVEGVDRKGVAWSISKPFTKAYCFGNTYISPPHMWRVQLRACEYARIIIREILEQKGVI